MSDIGDYQASNCRRFQPLVKTEIPRDFHRFDLDCQNGAFGLHWRANMKFLSESASPDPDV